MLANSIARSLSLIFLSAVVGACAPSAEEDEDVSSGAGAQSSSPLESGMYDAKEAILRVDGMQIMLYSADSARCEGEVEKPGNPDANKVSVTGWQNDRQCKLTLSQTDKGINVSGTFDLSLSSRGFDSKFSPRRDGALIGSYVSFAGITLDVSASTSSRISFKVTTKEGTSHKGVANLEPDISKITRDPKRDGNRLNGLDFNTSIGSCKERVIIGRKDGNYSFRIEPVSGSPSAECVDSVFYLPEKLEENRAKGTDWDDTTD